jgi:hypothetical protein
LVLLEPYMSPFFGPLLASHPLSEKINVIPAIRIETVWSPLVKESFIWESLRSR